jgi:predicted RNase H-like HicB family nuclease
MSFGYWKQGFGRLIPDNEALKANMVCQQMSFSNDIKTMNFKKVPIMQKQITAFIEREGNGYVALCPELDIASQGDTIEDARNNLREAIELFFETASPEEIQTRLHDEVYVTRLEIAIG